MDDEALSAHHTALVDADYNRTKRGLGSAPEGSGDKKAEVAAHYDRIKDRHRTLEQGSEILHLRNLNNWIKSALFQKHLFKGDKRYGAAVLDLACGKGGDMLKFRASNIATYVGVDIAANSVRDAVLRYNGQHGRPGMPFGATFMAGDFCAASISERLPPHLASTRFQLASCQFAMHYAFDSEQRASALLANAAGRLEIGHGIFVATIPDANVLVKRLRAADGLSFGNSLYRVAFRPQHASKAFASNASPFGIAYTFSLKEAVDECEEYLVHLPTLKRLARERGLELLYAANFTDFFANEWQQHAPLLERMKVLPEDGRPLSQEEWDVAHTYMVVAFRRFCREGEAALPPQPTANPGHRDLSPQADIIYLSEEAKAKADAEATARPPPKAADDVKADDDSEEELDSGTAGGTGAIGGKKRTGAGDGDGLGVAGSKRPRAEAIKDERDQKTYNEDSLFD